MADLIKLVDSTGIPMVLAIIAISFTVLTLVLAAAFKTVCAALALVGL